MLNGIYCDCICYCCAATALSDLFFFFLSSIEYYIYRIPLGLVELIYLQIQTSNIVWFNLIHTVITSIYFIFSATLYDQVIKNLFDSHVQNSFSDFSRG